MNRLAATTLIALLAFHGVPAEASDTAADGDAVQGALDGMEFVARIDVDAYDTPFDDRQVFANGTMFSEECQRRCDFGAHPYFTRIEGDSIAFVSDMSCADAPQYVRWEGRVTGDRIEGTAHWTVKRFYWTVERFAKFSGQLVPANEAQASVRSE